MRIGFIQVAFLLFATAGFGQVTWKNLDGPYGANMTAMVSDGNGTLLAAGGSGLYKSTDQGASWIRQSELLFFDLLFYDADRLLGVTASWELVESLDQGLTFRKLGDLPGTFHKIKKMPNGDLILTADPSQLKIFVSSDYGVTWDLRHNFQKQMIGDQFIKGNSLFVCTAVDGILRSDDEGSSFVAKNSWVREGDSPSVVSTAIGSDGSIFISTQYDVYTSPDNGETWTEITYNLAGPFYGYLAINGLNEVLYFDIRNHKTYKLNENEESWQVMNSVFPYSVASNGILLAESYFYFFGSTAGIQRISEDGTTWTNAEDGILVDGFNCIVVSHPSSMLVTSQHGTSKFSSGNWKTASFGPVGDIYPMTEKIFYSGNNMRSDDGGTTWRWMSANSGSTVKDSLQNLYTYVIEYPRVGPLIPMPRLFKSHDFGETWEDLQIPGLPILALSARGIYATNESVYLTGFNYSDGRSAVYRISMDEKAASKILESSTRLSDLKSKDGVLYVRTLSGLLRSGDGLTWKQIYSGYDPIAGITIQPMYGITGRVLWVGGLFGKIVYSLDQGETWTDVGIPTNELNVMPSNFAADRDGYVYVTVNNLGVMRSETVFIDPSLLQDNPCLEFDLSVNEDAVLCKGEMIALTASGGETYSWSPSNGLSGTEGSTITASPEVSTTYTVTAKDQRGCISTAAIKVDVLSTPQVVLLGNTNVCQGTSIKFQVAEGSEAASFEWTLPEGWQGSSVNESIIAQVGTVGGTISVKGQNSCGSETQFLEVNVLTAPEEPGLINGSSTLCSGAVQSYSIDPVDGATSYDWTLPPGWQGTSTTNAIEITGGAQDGIVQVAAVNECGRSTTTTHPLEVTILTVPVAPSAILGSTTVCAGSLSKYSISQQQDAESYEWLLPTGWMGNTNTNELTATAGNDGGILTARAVNTCGVSDSKTLAVAVKAAPNKPEAIVGNDRVCENSKNIYRISEVAGAVSYLWALPNGWTGSSTTHSIETTSNSNPGILSVSAVNDCGTSEARTISVLNMALPRTPEVIIGKGVVCAGTATTFSVESSGNATTFVWSIPSGWEGTSNANVIEVVPGVTGGSISVYARNACGSSGQQSLDVLSKKSPDTPGAILGGTIFCAGSSHVLSIDPVHGADSYQWKVPDGFSGSSLTNSIEFTVGNSSGDVRVEAINQCGRSALTQALTVKTVPPAPSGILGGATFCEGSTHTLSAEAVQGADSYQWTVPSDWSGESTSNSISITTGRSSGDVLLAAVNQCGKSGNVILAVTINPLPLISETIAGKAAVCSGTTTEYEIGSDQVDASYQWVLPEGWEGSTTTSTLSAKAGTSGGTLLVKAINSCGSSEQRQLLVEVLNPPVAPATIVGDVMSCAGTVHEYSVSSVSGADSYHWILPANWTGSSNESTISTELSDQGGIIRVKAVNQCGESTEAVLSVDVVSLDVAVETSGSSLMVSESNATYKWFDCDDFNTSLTDAASQLFHPKKSGHYGVMVMQGACMATSDCIVYEVVGLESTKTNDVSVYPIPARDQFTIEVADFSGPVQFELSNLQGQVILAGALVERSNPIELNQLTTGVYLLKIFKGNQATIQKVLVE